MRRARWRDGLPCPPICGATLRGTGTWANPVSGDGMTHSAFDLTGRVALVTGASGTLGQHFVRVLHEAGATVVLAARRTGPIEAEAARLGARATAVPIDVTDVVTVDAALAAIEARHGVCDLVVNNSGVAVTKRVLEQQDADWDGVLAVNLRGAFVNIASIIGVRPMAGVAPYAASKAGLLQLTRAMAIELARHRIRVNA